nr:transposon Ty3-G Gag-Pol polyprotein [Tanacetum cinerariifolium]
MSKEDEEKTAFYTDQGTNYYAKMSFKIKNIGATYQRLIDSTFQSHIGINLEAYVDVMTPEVAPERDDTKEWTLFTDGASNVKGSGSGLVLIGPSGVEHTYALRLTFDNTNNKAEYKALMTGLRITRGMNIQKLDVKVDSNLRVIIRNAMRQGYYWPTMHEDAKKEIQKCDSCQIHLAVFSTWMAFGGNTRDLGSFGEETDEITNLHQIHEEVLLTTRGGGFAVIKLCRRDPSGDSVRDLVTALRVIIRNAMRQGYYWPTMHEDAKKEIQKCDSCQIHLAVFSTWMAFGGNTRDLGSFGEETDEITNLHQIHEEVLLTTRGGGFAVIKLCRRDPSGDSVRDLVTASGRGRLNEDLK